MFYQCIVGWTYWNKTEEATGIFLSRKYLIRDSLMSIILIIITIHLSVKYTDDSQSNLDVITTVLSLVANWYIAKRFIDGFIIWVIVDIISVMMFISQGMYWTSGLYLILIGFAIQGYLKWKNNLRMVWC